MVDARTGTGFTAALGALVRKLAAELHPSDKALQPPRRAVDDEALGILPQPAGAQR